MNPNEYQVFEFNTGEIVNVPVEQKLRITRARPDGLPPMKFDKPRRPSSSSSTPRKRKQSGKGIGNSFRSSIPWIVYK